MPDLGGGGCWHYYLENKTLFTPLSRSFDALFWICVKIEISKHVTLPFPVGSVGHSPWYNLLDKGVLTFYEPGLNWSDLIWRDCTKDD